MALYALFLNTPNQRCINHILQKLVNETFQKLWFTPTPAHDKETMTRKILNITDVVGLSYVCVGNNQHSFPCSTCVFKRSLAALFLILSLMSKVAACRDTGYDWFEQLLQNVRILLFLLFNRKEIEIVYI